MLFFLEGMSKFFVIFDVFLEYYNNKTFFMQPIFCRLGSTFIYLLIMRISTIITYYNHILQYNISVKILKNI